MKAIPLTQGKVAWVDNDDYARLSARDWCATRNGARWYAVRRGERGLVRMHREILGVPVGVRVAHVNRDGLDNRRSNLAAVTHSQIGANQGIRKDNTSGFRGVSRHTHMKRWTAQIRVRGAKIHLGYFWCARDAANAYDCAAVTYFGPFARTNSRNGSAGAS